MKAPLRETKIIFLKSHTGFLSTIPMNMYSNYLIIRKNDRRIWRGFQRLLSPSVLPSGTLSWRVLAGKSNLSCLRIDLHHFRFCIPRKTRTIGSTAAAVYSSSNEFHTFSNLHAASAKLLTLKISETRSISFHIPYSYILLLRHSGHSVLSFS